MKLTKGNTAETTNRRIGELGHRKTSYALLQTNFVEELLMKSSLLRDCIDRMQSYFLGKGFHQ